MDVLFDGPVFVDYGQFYVQTQDYVSGATFAGQANGLCGASVAGALFLITATHTAEVMVRVERHDRKPEVDQRWEEIVEASLRIGSTGASLVQWAAEASWPLDLPPDIYRVRYSATGMQAAWDDVVDEGEPAPDCYLLQFWPAPIATDRIVKQTSQVAAYWHTAWKAHG